MSRDREERDRLPVVIESESGVEAGRIRSVITPDDEKAARWNDSAGRKDELAGALRVVTQAHLAKVLRKVGGIGQLDEIGRCQPVGDRAVIVSQYFAELQIAQP